MFDVLSAVLIRIGKSSGIRILVDFYTVTATTGVFAASDFILYTFLVQY
jgi:hypothetical protein